MTKAADISQKRNRRSPWIGYLATIAVEFVLTLILLAIHHFSPLGQYPILYVVPIMLAAYVFGEGPAILAFVIGLLAFDYFFVPPLHTPFPTPETPAAWASLIAYMIGASVVGFSASIMRKSRAGVKRALIQAEQEIVERKKAEEGLSKALEELKVRSEALDTANEELQAVNEKIAAQNEELHAEMDERRRFEAELREAKDHLEIWVKERTAELEQAVRTLSEEVIERVRAEQAVASERQRFNDVLETLPAYLVLLTPDYHVPFANRFFRERFGESEGRRCYEYLFGRDEPCEICETYTVMKTSAPHRWEWTGPDGRNYDIYDFPFTDTDGSTLIMEMGIDITERKQAETELEKHRDHLEELVHERTNELETANVQLLGEITERAKAEEALHSQVRSLQRALLPPKPLVIPGYDLAFKYIPAFAGEEIGGDFYDIFRTEEGKVGILIGDVSGKGIQAAAMAAGTRSTVRAFAYEYSAPAEAMEHANRLLTAQQPSFETFVTLFLLILDPETGHVIYSSAGHPPALVRRANTELDLFSGRNMPLGVIGGQTYDQAESSLNPGDKIVLYTDGVTEARQGASLFGVEGLRGILQERGYEEPEALVECIIAGASEFAQGKLRDDTAVVVIQRMEANGL